MDTRYLTLLNDEKIPFTLTYGMQKELQDYLYTDDRLMRMIIDPDTSDTVLKICLSDRNEKGQVIKEFDTAALAEPEEVQELLEYLFDYFSEFFLKNQVRIQKLAERLNQS
jgi:hypothetical protein